jgi:hypothetical protein
MKYSLRELAEFEQRPRIFEIQRKDRRRYPLLKEPFNGSYLT